MTSSESPEGPEILGYDSLALARRCAEILDGKDMRDICILDVRKPIQITDYFILGSGLNTRHLRAAGDFLERQLRQEGIRRRGVEGYQEGKWILIDFSDVVVHLLLNEQRSYYDLEFLWGDCPRVDWQAGGRRAAREA